MRFFGNIEAKVDEKGRVFVPSCFRKILKQEENQGLVLRRNIFEHFLVLYPEKVWDEQVAAIKGKTNMFDRAGSDNLRRFVAGAQSITLDNGGRMLIPRRFLEEANIKNEVIFIGVDEVIEIWNKQDAEALLYTSDTLGDNLERMMNPPKED